MGVVEFLKMFRAMLLGTLPERCGKGLLCISLLLTSVFMDFVLIEHGWECPMGFVPYGISILLKA
jgi:hypothetical protein